MCLETKVLASLQVILNFFFYFSKKMGRSGNAGNETFYGDADGLFSCRIVNFTFDGFQHNFKKTLLVK